MIRFLIAVCFVVFYLILGIPVLLAEWIIGKINQKAKDISCLRMIQWAFHTVSWICGVKAIFLGKENLPKDQAVLYVANHQSIFDIILTYPHFPDLTGFVAKKEVLKYPLLRDWMKVLYCLFLDRRNMKEGLKTILQGIEYIKKGISIFIFPEGTRSKTGKMIPFKEGSLKIAEKTGCLIIPVAITNTAEIFENHFPKVKPVKAVIEFGTPIDPGTLSKEEKKFLGAYTQKQIREMLDKNASLI